MFLLEVVRVQHAVQLIFSFLLPRYFILNQRLILFLLHQFTPHHLLLLPTPPLLPAALPLLILLIKHRDQTKYFQHLVPHLIVFQRQP